MRTTLGAMTLQELLKKHDIHTIRELTHRTGLSRQQGWNLWWGEIGVGKATAKLLHEKLGVPAEELLQVAPVPRRPRKSSASAAEAARREGGGVSEGVDRPAEQDLRHGSCDMTAS
jgi:hypothetical protein